MTATVETPAEYQARMNAEVDNLRDEVAGLARRVAEAESIIGKETDTDD